MNRFDKDSNYAVQQYGGAYIHYIEYFLIQHLSENDISGDEGNKGGGPQVSRNNLLSHGKTSYNQISQLHKSKWKADKYGC